MRPEHLVRRACPIPATMLPRKRRLLDLPKWFSGLRLVEDADLDQRYPCAATLGRSKGCQCLDVTLRMTCTDTFHSKSPSRSTVEVAPDASRVWRPSARLQRWSSCLMPRS